MAKFGRLRFKSRDQRVKKNKLPPEVCPNCGEDVPLSSLACPACGSDYETGWSEETYLDGLSIPDTLEGLDEFQDKKNPWWYGVAILIVIAFVCTLI